jgi:hypothetical protein
MVHNRGFATAVVMRSLYFTFESRISSPLEMGTLVVYPTTWELFRGISRVSLLTGMPVIVMSLSVIFLPAPRSVAATTTSIRSSVLSRTQAVELNASTNVRTVRDHFIPHSLLWPDIVGHIQSTKFLSALHGHFSRGSTHPTLHEQYKNCWIVPNGVWCSSLVLSSKRKCTPNSRWRVAGMFVLELLFLKMDIEVFFTEALCYAPSDSFTTGSKNRSSAPRCRCRRVEHSADRMRGLPSHVFSIKNRPEIYDPSR